MVPDEVPSEVHPVNLVHFGHQVRDLANIEGYHVQQAQDDVGFPIKFSNFL